MEESTGRIFGRIFDVDYRYKRFPTRPFPKGTTRLSLLLFSTIPLFCCAAVPGSPTFFFASFSHAP